jgi:hypothetical protein
MPFSPRTFSTWETVSVDETAMISLPSATTSPTVGRELCIFFVLPTQQAISTFPSIKQLRYICILQMHQRADTKSNQRLCLEKKEKKKKKKRKKEKQREARACKRLPQGIKQSKVPF